MVLFELLQLARVFLYYLLIEYLWHAFIMPLTNRNGIIGEFEEAGQYDVEITVVRAREAFFEWREQPASVRGGALANIADDVEKWAEELVRFTVMEVGKPIGEG